MIKLTNKEKTEKVKTELRSFIEYLNDQTDISREKKKKFLKETSRALSLKHTKQFSMFFYGKTWGKKINDISKNLIVEIN